MSNKNSFSDFFKHLAEYQNLELPDNKLAKDYIILYDHLMDMVEKDAVVGELFVRKKLQNDIQLIFGNSRYFVDVLEAAINLTIQRLCDWMVENKLCINASKTKAIMFRTGCRRVQYPEIKIHGTGVQFVESLKCLVSSINADVLLDLTKIFDIRSFVHEPFVCLTLKGRDNKRFSKDAPHPFCNEKLSIVPRNIKKAVWLALHNGLLMSGGSFVRGYQGDIYEINLTSAEQCEVQCETAVRLNAYSSDINLNINLRILINYSRHPSKEPSISKPYPLNELNREWLALLPRYINSPFEICLPKLECKMKRTNFNLVMILRVFRFLFQKHEKLCTLHIGFIESIIYSEYMELVRGSKKSSHYYDYIFKSVLTRIYNALKTKKHPCFWNARLNLMKPFDKNISFSNTFYVFNNVYGQFNKLRSKSALEYVDFLEFFDFKMDSFSYEVDQFGIFKSY